jgi:pyrimidine deaminase RibD-like protein
MIALSRAKRSVMSNFPKERHYRHCAMVVRGGAILSVGVNNKVLHAEIAALEELTWSERKDTMVISLRIRKDGSLAMGKPCWKCMAYMRQYGVKKIMYSLSNGSMIKERL